MAGPEAGNRALLSSRNQWRLGFDRGASGLRERLRSNRLAGDVGRADGQAIEVFDMDHQTRATRPVATA